MLILATQRTREHVRAHMAVKLWRAALRTVEGTSSASFVAAASLWRLVLIYAVNKIFCRWIRHRQTYQYYQ
jgi:hypothetical protein